MKKGKRKTRKEEVLSLIAFISGLFALFVSLCVSNGEFLKTFFITFVIALTVSTIVYAVLCMPIVKGKMGEMKVSIRLKKLLKRKGGYLINDLMIMDLENGKSSQVDHIYISKYGIFVIETKNYAGRIYGDESSLEWTQVLAFGHSKNKLYNPIKQNGTHISRIRKTLDMSVPIYSVIVFVQNNTEYIKSDNVYALYELPYMLDDKEISLTDEQVYEIHGVLSALKDNKTISNKEHIEEIRKTQNDISNNICPRCGSKLVLRNGKNGEFYGCMGYPKCRFTKRKE